MNDNNTNLVSLNGPSCPFVSGVLATSAGSAGVVTAPCSRDKCGVWSKDDSCCGILAVNDRLRNLNLLVGEYMESTKLPIGGTPTARIADLFEAFVNAVSKKWNL